MTVQAHNFRQPAPLSADVLKRIKAWFEPTTAMAPNVLKKYLPYPVTLSLQATATSYAEEAWGLFTDATVGYQVVFGDDAVRSLLIFPRPLCIALLSGLLGEAVAALPEDRPLSTVELSLWQYMLEQVFVGLAQETWTGKDSFNKLALLQNEPRARWPKLLPSDERMVICKFQITCPFGTHEYHWLLSHNALRAQFGHLVQKKNYPARATLEATVLTVPLQVIVKLGQVTLPLSSLSELHKGDLLILDKRLNDPLDVLVANVRKYRAWPGRVGVHQAVKIESVVED